MEATVNTLSFREFLQGEIDTRGMSVREFAAFCDVSHSVVVRVLDKDNPHTPSLDVLARVGKRLGVNLVTIIGMIHPDAADISSDAWLLAQQIDKLPDADRRFITNAVVGALMKVNK